MKLKEISQALNLVKAYDFGEEKEIKHGYTCDLLSEVMGKAPKDTIWITVQSHLNIIAVAVIVGIKAIIIANSHKADEKTIKKAKEEDIGIYYSDLNPFILSGKIFSLKIE
jgi:hypothetical protein